MFLLEWIIDLFRVIGFSSVTCNWDPCYAEAVIAIGIDVSKDGKSASPFSKEVARKAANLFCACGDYLIFTGGYSYNKGPTEAEAMHDWVKKSLIDIDPKRIIEERNSSKTYLNADYTLEIMKELNLKRAIIVAYPEHSGRVNATFRKRWRNSGIEFCVISSARTVNRNDSSQSRLHNNWSFYLWNLGAYIISKFKGYC